MRKVINSRIFVVCPAIYYIQVFCDISCNILYNYSILQSNITYKILFNYNNSETNVRKSSGVYFRMIIFLCTCVFTIHHMGPYVNAIPHISMVLCN